MNTLHFFRDRFLTLHCRWFDLIGEHLQPPVGETLEYWRVEKVDSVVILPIYQQQFLLPPPIYLPVWDSATWDFPGGRVPEATLLRLRLRPSSSES